MSEDALEKRLRWAGLLVMLGLVVEAVSLGWRHPTAFLVFVFLGGLCLAVGMLSFLMTIVKKGG